MKVNQFINMTIVKIIIVHTVKRADQIWHSAVEPEFLWENVPSQANPPIIENL